MQNLCFIEKKIFPQVAVGFRDIAGTGLFQVNILLVQNQFEM